MNISLLIKTLRKDRKMTQDEIAGLLGVSRVTYNQLENNKTSRDPYRTHIEDIFDISLDHKPSTSIARTLDDATYSKAKNLISYILHKTAHLPNVGKTVLYKLLYFCEFDRYELTGERLSGMDFVRLPRGPAPAAFQSTISQMTQEGLAVVTQTTYRGYPQQKYIPHERIPPNIYKEKQRSCIDRVLSKYQHMTATQISEYSHGDVPRTSTSPMALIDIHLANYRMYPYSAKAQQEKLIHDQTTMQNNHAMDFLLNEPDLYDDLI